MFELLFWFHNAVNCTLRPVEMSLHFQWMITRFCSQLFLKSNR